MKAKIHVKLENGEAWEFTQEVLIVDLQGFDIFASPVIQDSKNVKEIVVKPIHEHATT